MQPYIRATNSQPNISTPATPVIHPIRNKSLLRLFSWNSRVRGKCTLPYISDEIEFSIVLKDIPTPWTNTDLNLDTTKPSWKPSAFQAWVLASAALVCWMLIGILQFLLNRSQHDGGIIFSSDTSNLPLSQSFSYLYLPTILAILFSIFWNWIDLQVKRLEPYHQLSKPEGSLGKNSLLLQYPLDFIPCVPISAVKNRYAILPCYFHEFKIPVSRNVFPF